MHKSKTIYQFIFACSNNYTQFLYILGLLLKPSRLFQFHWHTLGDQEVDVLSSFFKLACCEANCNISIQIKYFVLCVVPQQPTGPLTRYNSIWQTDPVTEECKLKIHYWKDFFLNSKGHYHLGQHSVDPIGFPSLNV